MPGGYSKVERTATWDYLQAFIDAGEEVGLKVYAGINTMVVGNTARLGSQGVLFRDEDKKNWATHLITENEIKSMMEIGGTGTKFFNPVSEEVQDYIFNMPEDLPAYNGLKGIILDRGRFDGLASDFSSYTKEKFEKYLGYSMQNFPEDMMDVILIGAYASPTRVYGTAEWTLQGFCSQAMDKIKGDATVIGGPDVGSK